MDVAGIGRGRALWSWATGERPLPATSAGAEYGIALAFTVWRAGVTAITGVTLIGDLGHATRPWLDFTLFAACALWSVVLCARVLQRRAYDRALLAAVDVVLGTVVLALSPLYAFRPDLASPWSGAWAIGLTLNVSVSPALGFRSRRWFLAAETCLAAGYAIPVVAFGAHPDLGRVIGTAIAYPLFGVLVRVLATLVRDLGTAADEARALAATAAAAAERDRHRLLLHDHATVLRLLSNPPLNPFLADLLRDQAAAGANRVQAFLTESPGPPSGGAGGRDGVRAVPELVRVAAAPFADLPIELALDLAGDLSLPTPAADAVRQAITTLLHNVRVHAHATCVVVHADHDPDAGAWELTVRDDGKGFDPAVVELGFGLRTQVIALLAEHDISAVLHSEPGHGTSVVLRGTTTGCAP